MLLAASALVLTLLPLTEYAAERRAFIASALRINAAIRDGRSQIDFQTRGAKLLAVQDRGEARRFCREIRGREAIPCWSVVDPPEGPRVIAVWFAANGEEATASLTAAKLHKTFAEACKCEDAQCDSIEGRAGCSDNIDGVAQYLAEQKVDAAARAVI